MLADYRKRTVAGIAFLLTIILLFWVTSTVFKFKDDKRADLTLAQRIQLSLKIAQYRSIETIKYLKERSGTAGSRFPQRTRQPPFRNPIYHYFPSLYRVPQSMWVYGKVHNWSAGAFPGLLWKMYQDEADPAMRQYWETYAKAWSEPFRQLNHENPADVTMNNLFVFKGWYEVSEGKEKQQQLAVILAGANAIAKPYKNGKGSFHEKIGAFGSERKASHRDDQTHWHIFIDHVINVEQLLWAAEHNPDRLQAKRWQQQAIRHIKTIGKTLQAQQKVPEIGVWQRMYFDNNPASSTYGKFLFSGGKQGWKHDSIWSRGQAWFIYAACVTYQYTQDREVLALAKSAINYFFNNLTYHNFLNKVSGHKDFIAPWDFSYAQQKNPNTERDSSASAIAVAGILKLLKTLPHSDPDRQRYIEDVENLLWALTESTYLPDQDKPNASILKEGCYIHRDSLIGGSKEICRNGVIWGDYFFVDALLEYKQLKKLTFQQQG